MELDQTPDWRWMRINDLVGAQATPNRSHDDTYVQRGWRYWKRWSANRVSERSRIRAEYPDIHQARTMFEKAESGTRWVFEASVMARLSLEDAAKQFGCSPSILETYEALFFDVRGMLDNKLAVDSQLLFPTSSSISAGDYDLFWKFIAYYGGWNAVQQMWSLDAMPPGVEDFLKRITREKILKNGAAAAHAMEINRFTTVPVVDQVMRLAAAEEMAGAGQSAGRDSAALGEVLKSVGASFHLISSRDNMVADEPRADDLMRDGLEIVSSSEDE
jgi:hypothetical protein